MSTSTLLKSIAGYDGLTSALTGLENLLHELESLRYRSDLDRDRYNLIASILSRLKTILSDLQCFEKNQFAPKQAPTTETIGLFN